MNKSTIHRIILTVLLLTTQNSLFAMEMELVPFPLSNSSSEMYFLINNITPQYPVPKDIKEKLLKLYITATNEEREQASKHTFIKSSDYMDLNKENKLRLANFWYSDRIKIEGQTIVFHSHDASQHYTQMLKLPQKIRRQIAKQYSSTVLVKTKDPNKWMDKKQAANRVAIQGLILAASAFISPIVVYKIISYYDAWNNPIVPSATVVPMVFIVLLGAIYIMWYVPETRLDLYHYNGYGLLSLLPKDDTK